MTTTQTTDVALRRIVEVATRAPSVGNTQPWRWRGNGHTLDLYADRSRRLARSDPDGRHLVISCGCVLHHVQVVAGLLGWAATVTRFPDPTRTDHLARVDLEPATAPTRSASALGIVRRRSTDRRRFTSWPVPEEQLAELARAASPWQAHAIPVVGAPEHLRTELLVNRAAELHDHDQTLVGTSGTRSGPTSRHDREPGPAPARRSRRFPPLPSEDWSDREVEAPDGLILMWGHEDDPQTWLRTGEGLSALWLAATAAGLAVVPLSEVIEVPRTRESLRHDVLGGLAHPMLALRVGWQAIGRSDLPPSPRRPVDEVLDVR